MATGTITSTGLGSGLNIESLVSKLMSVESQPITLLQTKSASYQTKLSSWGQVSANLSSLQVAADALRDRSAFSAYTANIEDASVASVSASPKSSPGVYSLEVSQLADVQKIKSSGGYASPSSQFTSSLTTENPTANLVLEIGETATTTVGQTTSTTFTPDSTKTKTITIDSTNNTLEGVRNAINNAKIGMTASLVNDGGSTPYRLVITGTDPGSDSSFKISGLSDFSFDPATGSGVGTTQIQAATDAKLSLDGINITKHSNTVTDAIDGTTLKLTKTNVGSPTKVSVAPDAAAVETKVTAFVTAYNNLASVIKQQTSYDPATKTSGTLNGDMSAPSIMNQLRSILTSAVGKGSLSKLSDVGIAFQKDGSLKLDTGKFDAALTDPTKDVAEIFVKGTTTEGIASQISQRVQSMLSPEGLVTAHTASINKAIDNTTKQIDVLNTRMTAIEARYRAQFTAMDKTVASLNSTSSYLSQQLNSLTKRNN
jgi:flagellar hook-associated protein 2